MMRLLFSLDTKDYDPEAEPHYRPSARGILIRGGRIAMVHGTLYDYYKFPGGGIEQGEDPVDALIREVREEAGLLVVRSSVVPYGRVHRVKRDPRGGPFVQENYYYLCEAEGEPVGQSLDGYEAEEGFTPVWADPAEVISVNRSPGHGPKDRHTLEREARVMEMLVAEGYFAEGKN